MKNIKIKIQLKEHDIDIISSQIGIAKTKKEKIQLIKKTINKIVIDYFVSLKENSTRKENEARLNDLKDYEIEYFKQNVITS